MYAQMCEIMEITMGKSNIVNIWEMMVNKQWQTLSNMSFGLHVDNGFNMVCLIWSTEWTQTFFMMMLLWLNLDKTATFV